MDLTPEQLESARQRLRESWLRRNPEKTAADLPDYLRAAEPREERRSPDYLGQIFGWLKSKFGDQIDEAEFREAHHAAMSSAGGLSAARKRRSKKQLYAEEVRDHAMLHPEPQKGCELCYDSYGGASVLKLPKNDPRVSYTTGTAEQQCYGCRFYGWGTCNLVEGAIEAEDVCDLWLKPVSTYPTTLYAATAGEHGRRLFVEQAHVFADPPDWINVIPKPGTYSHPAYGDIVITPERNERFIQNFDARVYQQDIPIQLDLEHNGTMSGGIGYMTEMRQNEDGSVDARVQWTERGKTLIEADAFKYVSPEWFDVWVDPATDVVYQDLIIGAAICTRPFFKETALRPLVATEGGLATLESLGKPYFQLKELRTSKKEESVEPEEKGTEKPAVEPVAFTEADVRELAELRAAKAAAERAVEEKDALVKRVADLEAEGRQRRFTDVVLGRDPGADGARAFIGEVKDNVASLERLAAVFGEDSDEFKAEVALRRSAAQTLHESGAFKPAGSTETETHESDVEKSVEKRVADLMASESGLTYRDAMNRVFSEDGELFEAYRRATTTSR